jgi:hypothetical protein
MPMDYEFTLLVALLTASAGILGTLLGAFIGTITAIFVSILITPYIAHIDKIKSFTENAFNPFCLSLAMTLREIDAYTKKKDNVSLVGTLKRNLNHSMSELQYNVSIFLTNGTFIQLVLDRKENISYLKAVASLKRFVDLGEGFEKYSVPKYNEYVVIVKKKIESIRRLERTINVSPELFLSFTKERFKLIF